MYRRAHCIKRQTESAELHDNTETGSFPVRGWVVPASLMMVNQNRRKIMKRAEKAYTKSQVIAAISEAVAQEKRYCAEYSKLNPDQAERRQRDAELFILGAQTVLYKL